MKRTTKILLILVSIFIFRLALSCCRCPEEIIFFDYNEVSIHNLNNSEIHTKFTDYNTMFSAAVAFEIRLSDSTYLQDLISVNNFANLGFSSARAMQPCDCLPIFKPSQEIMKISIFTLEEMSPQISANTEVTDHFLTRKEALYQSLDVLTEELNSTFQSFQPLYTIRIYCKDNIENDKAQFAIYFYLSDGRIITVISNLIHIKQSF